MQEHEEIVVYGTAWCSDCKRSRKALDRIGRSYRYVDIEKDAAAAETARVLAGVQKVPVIALPGGLVLVEPSDLDLIAAATGIAAI